MRQGVANPSEPTCFANGSAGYFCSNYQVTLTGTAPVSCGRGMQAIGASCVAYSYPLPSVVQPATGQTLQQAINNIPAADLNKQLNPAIVAALADQAWKNARCFAGLRRPSLPSIRPNHADQCIAGRTPTRQIGQRYRTSFPRNQFPAVARLQRRGCCQIPPRR